MTNEKKKANQKSHGIVFKIFWLIVIIVLAAAGTRYVIRYAVDRILYISTDDAFIDGHIVSISPKVSGQITKVLVGDNQEVKKGDLLVTIDPRDYQAEVNIYQAALQVSRAEAQKARANISAAKAQMNRAETDLKRYEDLKGTAGISKQQLDKAKTAAVTARAGLEVAVKQAAAANARIVQAQADLKQAGLILSYTRIYAPQDGTVAQKHAEAGSFVQAGQPLMAIIPCQVWVTANFKETHLQNIHPGQEVIIRVDAFTGKKFRGRVNSIQPGTGASFSLLPPENATGNYIKVIQRVPVKITFDEPVEQLKHLGLGMSVEPAVYTAGKKSRHSWWLPILEFLGGVNPAAGEDGSK